MVEEDDALGLGTLPLMKLISELFKAITCFSIIVFETPFFYSFFNGSYGVFPSSPNTLSSFDAASTNFSMSIKVHITHNF